MLKSTNPSKVKKTSKVQNTKIKLTTKKSLQKKVQNKSQQRQFSTILTGEEDFALPGRTKRATTPKQSAAAASQSSTVDEQQQQQQQAQQQFQQQLPKLDFNDPQVVHSVNAWNGFIRNKTAPVFQKAFQNILVAHKVIPFPTTDDFKNPQQHILQGLLNHGILMEENDTRTLPDDIIKLQNDIKSKLKDDHISLDKFIYLMEFYKVLPPGSLIDPQQPTPTAVDNEQSQKKYKFGLVNHFIQHKPGSFTTDPTAISSEQIQAKVKANERLGLDMSTLVGSNSILDVLGYCAEAAGGLDLREYIVTVDRPNSHVIFMDFLRQIPPPGDLLTSDFSRNHTFPFSPLHLEMFPDLAQGLEKLQEGFRDEKSPQNLLQLSLQVARRDIFAVWKKQNPELSARFLQCGLNPLIQFNEEEINNIKSMMIKQFIQNVLVNKYLFSPFQKVLYSVNISTLSSQEELGTYYKQREDAVFGYTETDTPEQRREKRAIYTPDQALSELTRLTDHPFYMQIHQGKSQLILQALPASQKASMCAKFSEALMQGGLIDVGRLNKGLQERFPGIVKNQQPDELEMLDFMQTFILDAMVQHGVVHKRPNVEDNDDNNNEENIDLDDENIPLHFGSSITTELQQSMNVDGVEIVNPTTQQKVVIKTYEQELIKQLQKFGILNHKTTKKYMINSLSPIILPQEPPEEQEFKQSIITQKLLPVNVQSSTVPTLPGQPKPMQQDPNQLSTFQKILLTSLVSERSSGDNDPNTSFPIPASEEELAHLTASNLVELQPGADTEGLGQVIQYRSDVQQILQAKSKTQEGLDEELNLPEPPKSVPHIVSRAFEGSKHYKLQGWVRNFENDQKLAEGTMFAIDRAITTMSLPQLRDFVSRQFNHDVAMHFAQEQLDLFTYFSRDMHSTSFTASEMGELRFMASQMVTQALLKAHFRSDQMRIKLGDLPADQLTYNHVLFTTPEQLAESKSYFFDTTRFDKAAEYLQQFPQQQSTPPPTDVQH